MGYYIVGTLAVLSVLYYIFVMPRIMKKYKGTVEDVKKKMVGNEDSIRKELLSNPEKLKLIVDKIEGENIVGLANAMEKRGAGDLLKSGAVNLAGSALGRVTGVGIKSNNNLDVYFVVLTDNNLHYMVYDEGTCEEHLIYDRSKISRMSVDKASLASNYTGGASGTKKLTFDYDGKNQSFYLIDGFLKFPTDSGDTMNNAMMDDLIHITELYVKPLLKING